jgi:sugar lactone lactonase YvrE
VPQKRIPDSPVSASVDGGKGEVGVTEIALGEDVYAHDASTQPTGSDGEVLLSANPFEINVGDGEGLYVMDGIEATVFQWHLPSPYDLSTASVQATFSVGSTDSDPHGLTWGDDGSKFYFAGSENDSIYQYECDSAFDVGTATLSGTFTVPDSAWDVLWNNDGSKFYVLGRVDNNIYEYDCGTSFDVTTGSLSVTFDVRPGGEGVFEEGIAWNNDGSKLHLADNGNKAIRQYELTAPFDLSTASKTGELDVSPKGDAPYDVAWTADGSRLYVPIVDTDKIHEYVCSTPFDVTTGSHQSSFGMKDRITRAAGIAWSTETR